jgi:hypothetical protein
MGVPAVKGVNKNGARNGMLFCAAGFGIRRVRGVD